MLDRQIDRQTERNYGIDALRLFAMFMVVILHVLGHGGVLEEASGKEYYICYAFESFSYCAVDCYAIISGYVAYTDKEKQLNYCKYGKIWFQVFFYSFLITLIFYFIPQYPLGKIDIIQSFFPVSFNRYWYFTEYTALFFMMPWINKLIRTLSKRNTSILAIVIICIFSIYTTFIQRIKVGFQLAGGYSFIWLSLLYIIGCWMKKCCIPERIKASTALMLLAIFAFVPYAYTAFSEIMDMDLGVYLVSYSSVFTLGTAVLLVILFSQIKVSGLWVRIISIFAPAAFGVYLIHEHPCIRDNLINNSFSFIANYPIWGIPVLIFGSAIVIFFSCLIIEKVRLFLFSKLRINEFAVNIAQKMSNILNIILKRFIVE